MSIERDPIPPGVPEDAVYENRRFVLEHILADYFEDSQAFERRIEQLLPYQIGSNPGDAQKIVSFSDRQLHELNDWMGDNCAGIWACWTRGYYFSNPRDLIAFRLRWL